MNKWLSINVRFLQGVTLFSYNWVLVPTYQKISIIIIRKVKICNFKDNNYFFSVSYFKNEYPMTNNKKIQSISRQIKINKNTSLTVQKRVENLRFLRTIFPLVFFAIRLQTESSYRFSLQRKNTYPRVFK